MKPNLTFLLIAIAFFSCSLKESIDFKYDSKLAPVAFAVSQLEESIIHSPEFKSSSPFKIISFNKAECCSEQGYVIEVDGSEVSVNAPDAVGLMYGGLDLAEQIRLKGAIDPVKKEPYLKKRGIKFNIPLDARTPSYDDTGDAAQKNIAVMWSWDFWKEFLDQMAINRYNVLSLWNPHPFPSMIKMENYPDVALNDVCVTTLKPIGKENEWAEPQMVSKNVIENMEVVKTMTIDEKIAFWKKVMQYANDRGIDLYFITWNVCPNGAANPVEPFYRTYKQEMWSETPGKYGITNQMDNPKNVPYFREAVKTFLLTYPNVKGIGVTAGEHMVDHAGEYTREQWIWEAYGLGILDAKAIDPDRQVDFIHRVWNADLDKIMSYWKQYPDTFEVSFKYAKARLYSSPYLNFANSLVESMKDYKLKSWWNLRNDDIFVYRWGDPDYVRDFIGHFKREFTAGFYMGSDGYVWGREFISKRSELSGELEVKKHWFNFMLWGRLAYDQSLDNDFFVQQLKSYFPGVDGQVLLNSWQQASKIIPLVNCFHWRDWDYQWSVEVCLDEREGFNTVTHFMNNKTLVGSNMLSPKDYARMSVLGELDEEITPYQVADRLNLFSENTFAGLKQLRTAENSIHLTALLDDMEAMAWLGKYYASKIKASTELSLLKVGRKESHRAIAISELEKAVGFWEQYAAISEKNYRPQMLARTAELDWGMRLEQVVEDVAIAKKMKVE